MFETEYQLPEKEGDIRRLGNLQGSARGLLTAEIAAQHPGLMLCITNDSDSAIRLKSEINFFSKETDCYLFSDWETLAYDNFSPHQDIVSERLNTLFKLPQLQQGILIVPASTLMHRVAPTSFLDGNSLIMDQGQTLNLETMRRKLTDAGYHLTETVYEHGEFAIRGSIIDIFPMGSTRPYRIELFDDEVETLRTFDPENQRSLEQVSKIRLLPAKEFPFDEQAISSFKQRWRETFDVDYKRCSVYQDISSGISPPGIEYYQPLFFDHNATLFDYLPDNALILTDTNLEEHSKQFWHDVQERYEERRHDIERPILSPEKLFIPANELFKILKPAHRIQLQEGKTQTKAGRYNLPFQAPPELTINAQDARPLAAIESFLNQTKDSILFCAESAGRREALLELLARIDIKPHQVNDLEQFFNDGYPINICIYPLEKGLSAPGKFHLITESQLFGHQVFQRRRRSKEQEQSDQVIKNLTELNISAPVVHIDHGVGRYQGLVTLQLDSQTSEFLMLEYANEAKLYVPVASLHLISRYSGAGDELAPLHRLGTEQWSKARKKAAEKVRDTAVELLDIYARRAARKGHQFDAPDEHYASFSAAFPFEETIDQANAIQAVVKDMSSKQPMDRLVCGDVGFGKTEVAMRAAFMAAQSGKQVAILVPTTLLAQQHFENFRDRFADWPVNVELISRFRSGKQTNSVIESLQQGKTDIVIGTHKLIQGNIKFNDLGLLIIDEEHRFGVQQKERLKSLRSEVDILTLTATPIPRTLNMAMSGIRDLSIIATPPARRLSVKTFVRQSDNALKKEAVLRELLRGGQVYYLHNEVKTIEQTAREISELIPEARVAIGHGQMRERELEQVMSDFYHKRYNVLVCTTIIETGIDIPNANTIIIDRADKFGLAQLHQLRGRVGRSHHQAYAYLMTPHHKAMTGDAVKRLDAIASADDLGAGFTLATHDMEIRGAGELLGEDQSGQIQNIGFSLYMEMLEQAVESIREGKTPNLEAPLKHGAEINLRLPALIPDDYLPDVHNRLIMYKRIASANSNIELKELQVEMIDRFGILPEQTKNLFRQTLLKLQADKLGISKIDAGDSSGRIDFEEDTCVDPFKLVQLIQQQPQKYQFGGASQLKFTLNMDKIEQRFKAVEQLLQQLTEK
ncbi:transcription-repair coupling factor [Amphritea balenae]|uniref:Transcription-repair-coupling factor n=1 Tax=Amphritea balenae TaxID=452629 RepID=A0A3P1SU21_9GAMM|nr:transcription-repair coupling factor [Amphritea balenae]RRD00651.1 transcription-repair coupling factor [Amphritea balenae]GGK69009.1 transcription-repair-coupling factor [Amphritea balenae]